jgi:hypothetical protein
MRLLLPVYLVAIFSAAAGCSGGTSQSDETLPDNLDARIRHIKQQDAMASDEGQARKERSIAILKAEKVPFAEQLPQIATESESVRRTTEEVAMRAMALCIVAAKADGLEQEVVDRVVKEFELESAFTPKEKGFIDEPEPSRHDCVQFVWRYECYWVMLWALGFIDELDRPDHGCDAKHAVSVLLDNGRDGFLKKAKLRPQSELLDAADLIYRYHWAVVDARIENLEAPAELSADVVVERHYALNWLIGYMNQEWDDISTDT